MSRCGQVYASCDMNSDHGKLETFFQIPWAKGFLRALDNSITYSCEAKDGIPGPKQMQFIEQYGVAFTQKHEWVRTDKDSTIYKECPNCGAKFSIPAGSNSFYERLTLAGSGIVEFCDMQVFQQSLLKISQNFNEGEAWTISFDKLDIPSELANRLDDYASLYFIMQQ